MGKRRQHHKRCISLNSSFKIGLANKKDLATTFNSIKTAKLNQRELNKNSFTQYNTHAFKIKENWKNTFPNIKNALGTDFQNPNNSGMNNSVLNNNSWKKVGLFGGNKKLFDKYLVSNKYNKHAQNISGFDISNIN